MTAVRKLHHRGVEIDADLAGLLRHMPAVDATRESLQGLQGVWDSLAMLGELSGTGVEIAGVRTAFADLSSTLVNELGRQARRKAAAAQQAKAQVAIDILVRNLFERTADIGFLATDDDLRAFALSDAAGREDLLPALRQRLREYQRKYSVYDDIVLLAPDGRVLAQLDERVGLARTRDRALVDETLSTSQPCVESYRSFDLRPGAARTLVYACRVTDGASGRAVGVLCLCFRFEDECDRIFRTFLGADDWTVVTLLDAEGRTLASSDPFQVPPGASVPAPADGQPHLLRFGGRHWLAVGCAAQPFQGYAGPGWRAQAMTPVEHAFGDEGEAGDAHPPLDAATAEALRGSRVLHPEALHQIEGAAQRIEADLSRAVWNGNIALIAAGAGAAEGQAQNAGFSRTLLREIGRTGARTREVFTQALAEVGGTVATAALAASAARAAFAVDVMDRSLYERANDCRWWALTTGFRRALEAPEAADPAALGRILRTIHGLYTVYANLVLFDREGRIVASSREEGAAAPGQRIEGEWVKRTLALAGTQAYCVSAFEPSPLYDGRATYVYAAAVRGLAVPSRVVGGVAIVFDGEPQFRSMLHDGLPRDVQGVPVEGAFGVFVDRDGRVIASSDPALAVGEPLDVAAGLRAADDGDARVVNWRGRWYSVGVARSTGYREFKGEGDPYREDVLALAFDALTDASGAQQPAAAPPSAPRRSPALRGDASAGRIDLATLRIGEQWHALPGLDLVEAIRADTLLPLPGTAAHVRGSVMFRNAPIAVLDADRLLGRSAASAPSQQRQIVVLRPRGAKGRAFGLLVDALGDNPQVSPQQLVRLAEAAWQRGPTGAALIDTVVAAAPGSGERELLTLLSVEALASLL